MTTPRPPVLATAALVLIVLLALSGLRPFDRVTWVLEVFPVVLVLPLVSVITPVSVAALMMPVIPS